MRRSKRHCFETCRRWTLPLFAAVFAASAAQAGTPPPSCLWDERFVSTKAKPLPVSAFAGIDRRLTIREIVAKLGPAQRDVGSGVHVLQWRVADGRWFSVSVPDACNKALAAGFLRPVKPPRPGPGVPPVR